MTIEKSGFVALVGRPNVGKSTLLNHLLGEKVSIVTPKAQTTRHSIQGIWTLDGGQIVLVDTPGMPRGKTALHRLMRRRAGAAATQADVAVVMVEIRGPKAHVTSEDKQLVDAARQSGVPLIILLNKIDRVKAKEELLPWIQVYSETLDVATVVPVSAKTGDGLDGFGAMLLEHLPEGGPLFPVDLHTDQAERFICGELIREQVLLQTQEEVPHCSTVMIDSFEDHRDNAKKPLVRLEGRIVVERQTQKAIMIGKGGLRIKSISEAGRKEIEAMLDCQVFIRLQVQVDANWTDSQRALRAYELDLGA
jgi:GTPase